jgi:hypothetical protein
MASESFAHVILSREAAKDLCVHSVETLRFPPAPDQREGGQAIRWLDFILTIAKLILNSLVKIL